MQKYQLFACFASIFLILFCPLKFSLVSFDPPKNILMLVSPLTNTPILGLFLFIWIQISSENSSFYNKKKKSFYKQSVLQCDVHQLVRHALACDWWQHATIPDPEWPLVLIDSSQQANLAGLCALFVKGIFHQTIEMFE